MYSLTLNFDLQIHWLGSYGQPFGRGNVCLFNSLQSDEHRGADIDERCRSYLQKLFCWQENVRNSWRMSTSISCTLTHSLCSSFVSQIIPIAWSENARVDVFSTFFIPSLWESWRKNDLRRICRWAAAEGGRWPSRGKVLTREKRHKKNRRSAAKNWVALYVGGYVETWDWSGPLNLHNEAQEQSGPYPW